MQVQVTRGGWTTSAFRIPHCATSNCPLRFRPASQLLQTALLRHLLLRCGGFSCSWKSGFSHSLRSEAALSGLADCHPQNEQPGRTCGGLRTRSRRRRRPTGEFIMGHAPGRQVARRWLLPRQLPLPAQGAFKKKKQKTGVPTYLPFFEIF
jgi:hypothetical protein